MGKLHIRDVISQPVNIAGVTLKPVILIVDFEGSFSEYYNSRFYYNGSDLNDTQLGLLLQQKLGSQYVTVSALSKYSHVAPPQVTPFDVTANDWRVTYTKNDIDNPQQGFAVSTQIQVSQASTGYIIGTGYTGSLGYTYHGVVSPLIMLKDVNTSKFFVCSPLWTSCVIYPTNDISTRYSGVVTEATLANGEPHNTNYPYAHPVALMEYEQPPADDPYDDQGGSTTPGGGGGIGVDNIINDDIDFPTPVAASAANANFISIWTPTLDQVQSLASWMWTTDPLKWGFWQKLLQNPLDLIFSLSIMPIPIHHTDDPSTPSEEDLVASKDSLSLGWQDTGIEMDWVTEQYVTIDMGTIDLEEVWGAFLDYEPYTKIDIFLPYIGTKQLDTNDCMPRTISLRYIIDLATGTCVALIKCDNSVYYHFSGNCASQIPITVNQCQEIVRGLMTMAVGAATFAIGGAMGAGAHVAKAAATKGLAMQAGGASMMGSGADNAAKGVNVSRSGVIGCAAGLMDIQTPYLIISRPRQAVPEEQSKYTGYPSFMTKQIGDLSGYTEIQIIHLEHMTCTDEEYEEINTLLLEGVII